MSVFEEVKHMKERGLTQDKIISTMREKGVPYRDISEALSQSEITSAIEQPTSEPQIESDESEWQLPPEPKAPSFPIPTPGSLNEMQEQTSELPVPRSQDSTNDNEQTPDIYPETTNIEPYPSEPYQDYPSSPEQAYDEYGQPYDYGGISSDTITEISEQVVSEKMSDLRKHIEKIIDFKTTIDSKIESVDERLKKIEKTIDALQTSVLRKVGNYVTDVEDLQKEMLETQKSFSKLAEKKHSHASHSHPINKTTHHKTHHRKTRNK